MDVERGERVRLTKQKQKQKQDHAASKSKRHLDDGRKNNKKKFKAGPYVIGGVVLIVVGVALYFGVQLIMSL